MNSYRNFINIKTKEGQAALANAIDKFTSPLVGDERLSLAGSSFQKLKDIILRLGSCYGYDYLIKKVSTRRTVDQMTGDVTFDLPINMIERYSDDNVELAQKHASYTWGDRSFTVSQTNTISELTLTNGFLNEDGNLTDAGKDIVLERMHSKFLGHHLLELLNDSARQAIEQNCNLYTWSTVDGYDEEKDGLTILALILGRIRPNFKVDMYAEIGKVKKLTIAQYNNDVQLYFDAIKYIKLQIDQKDPTAYTDDSFIRDIFLQLKHESLPPDFRLEFSRQETQWMMNKTRVTSQSLIDDASAYYVNLKNTGTWKTELARNCQIIALTTQISELKTEVSRLSAKAPAKQEETATPSDKPKYVFELWRLEKVDNKLEHNMVQRDGKTWYWCDKHKHNGKNGVISNGMYVTHKPDQHDNWFARKSALYSSKKGRTLAETSMNDKLNPTNASVSHNTASKLSLSKSLQAALVSTTGISEDQFNKIWSDACTASGN
ncbi:MAG: hypothetical protein ACRC1D_04680 [Culicoidibacterales bacterium]